MGNEKFLATFMIPLVMHSGMKQHFYERRLIYLMASEGFLSIHFNIRTVEARSLGILARVSRRSVQNVGATAKDVEKILVADVINMDQI